MAEAATPSQRPLSHSGLRIRLEPTLAQRRSMSRCAGASRFAFNWAISHVAANAAMWRTERDCGVESSQRTKPFTLVDLTKLWSLERSSVAPWWGDHPSKVYLFAFRDAVAASRNFLGSRARFPRFKAKHRTPRAFTLCDCIHLRPGELQITRIGKVKISAPDEHQAALRRLIRRGRARITSVRVTYYDGHWWASLAIERQIVRRPSPAPAGTVVGVDLGLHTLAVVCGSDAAQAWVEEGGRHARTELARTRRFGRAVSRRKQGSRRHRQAQRALARAHARTRRRRADDLHRLSKKLVTENAIVVVEDLAVKGISRSLRLGAATLDQGLGELRRQLTYKAKRAGCRIIVADRFYASSKTCARCRAVRAKLPLHMRTYRCDRCGTICDRDVNAAANLAAYGEAVLVTEAMARLMGQGTSVGDPDRPGPSASRPRIRGQKSHARREGSAGQLDLPSGGTALCEAGSSQQLVCAKRCDAPGQGAVGTVETA